MPPGGIDNREHENHEWQPPLAGALGQLLNPNSLAADCGISQPTARQWLTVLQASYLVALLPIEGQL